MNQINPRPIMFLDEPYLSAFGSAFTSLDRETVLSLFKGIFMGIDCLKDIHCCGNTDWSMVLDCEQDILSFDAYSYMDSIFLYKDHLARFLDRGGIIAWGIVPTDKADIEKETPEDLLARLDAAWERLVDLGFDQKNHTGPIHDNPCLRPGKPFQADSHRGLPPEKAHFRAYPLKIRSGMVIRTRPRLFAQN